MTRGFSERWPRAKFGCFGGGIVAAPILAFVFDPNAGLLMAATALLALGWLALTAPMGEPRSRRRLRVLAGINGVLALACLGVLVIRVLAG